MKKISFALVIMTTLFSNSSCKKTTIQSETIETIQKSKNHKSSQARIIQDCQYTKLTQTSPGIWEANFGGANLKFSDLHIKSYDPRLFGRLISAGTETANIIITGNEDYNQHSFAIQQPYCTGGGGGRVLKVTTTMSAATFNSISQYQDAYVAFQNFLSGANSFNLLAGTISVGDIITLYSPPPIYQQTTYTLDGTQSMDCSQVRLVVGKLLAKGVTILPNGQYTWTEVGVANMCYPDPKAPLALPE